MKNSEPTNNHRDVFLWTGVVLATIAAAAGGHFFHVKGPIQVLVWLVWLVVVLSFAFFTSKGKQVFAFAVDAKTELKKVVWPTRQETVQTTSIVMLMVGLSGFVLWGVDSVMMWAIGKITHLG